MTEELKTKIIKIFQYWGDQDGKEIEIVDKITTLENNYDRHFTTTSILKFKQNHFGVRFSGAIGSVEGENQFFEFRMGSIENISQSGNEIEITSKIKDSVFRMIRVKIK